MTKEQREGIEKFGEDFVAEGYRCCTECGYKARNSERYVIAGATHVYETKAVLEREVLDEVISVLNDLLYGYWQPKHDEMLISALSKLKQAREVTHD